MPEEGLETYILVSTNMLGFPPALRLSLRRHGQLVMRSIGCGWWDAAQPVIARRRMPGYLLPPVISIASL